jgi:hypothetical protein
MKAILVSTILIGLLLSGSAAPRQIEFKNATPVGMLALQNGGVVTATMEKYGRGYALHLAYFEAGQTMPKAETWSEELPGLPIRTTITGCDTTVHVMAEFVVMGAGEQRGVPTAGVQPVVMFDYSCVYTGMPVCTHE